MLIKRLLLLVAISLNTAMATRAQYTLAGKIEYERKINVHAGLQQDDDNEWFERVKSTIPKFKSAYFDLYFDTARSIYKPGRELEENATKNWWDNPASDNI